MTAQPFIISLGSINADFQVRASGRPDAGRVLVADSFTRFSGGKAANRAFVARRLGVPARLHGRVGDDDLRSQALAGLEEAGIDLSGVSSAKGCATAVSMITVMAGSSKAIVLAENANMSWDGAASEVLEQAIAAAPEGSVLACDYEVPAEIVRRAVEAAVRRGMAVLIDPSPTERVEPEVLARATAVAPNASEAEELTGIAVDSPKSAAAAARRLAERGIARPLVKLSDGGCVVAEDGCFTFVPVVPVDVVDSTGAGDAFAGALAVALLEGQDAAQSACFASAASHLAVTVWGSQPAYPDRERLNTFMPRLSRSMRQIDG